jgi:hypothetical protein
LLVEILPPETTELASPAENARLAVDRLLDDIRDSEFGLAANYARLGAVLFDIRSNRFYEGWGFGSFGSYINNLHERVQKGRSQLYACISVAEKLLPYLEEHQLVAIGISKAEQLKKFVQQSGLRPPARLVEKALDDAVTIKGLREEVFRELHQEPDPEGRWYDFGGCYLLPDEKAEVEQAITFAKRMDPLIPHNIPSHMQMKEVLLRWAREFAGTYAHLAEER